MTNAYYHNIPTEAIDQINTLVPQGAELKTIAFTNDGGFAIIVGKNGYSTNNIPSSDLNILSTLHKQESSINTIAFTPDGEWVIVYNG